MRLTVLLAALCAVLFASSAEARKFDPRLQSAGQIKLPSNVGCSDPGDVMRPCTGGRETSIKAPSEFRWRNKISGLDARARRPRGQLRPSHGLRRVMAEGAGRVIGGRPEGCPYAYCGCGASLYLFGKIVPALNLAANWLRFPRAEPAPGMVAARRGHVFVLVRHIRGKVWLAHDSNSGRHRTRVHPRSIAGFVIVDPRAGA